MGNIIQSAYSVEKQSNSHSSEDAMLLNEAKNLLYCNNAEASYVFALAENAFDPQIKQEINGIACTLLRREDVRDDYYDSLREEECACYDYDD